MPTLQAIVFDLDDTLYPERDYVLGGFRAVAAWGQIHLGIPSGRGFAELEQLFEQGARGDTFDRWLAAYNPEWGGLTPRLVQVYRQHQPALSPFPGVPDLLLSLGQHYRLGLLSDGYLAVQQRKLAALGLAHHFDAIVFSDKWGREAWKPSTVPFRAILQRLEVDAAQSLYVGDNPLKDFLGARQVGMFTVRVRRPGGEYAHQRPPSEQHRAEIVIESLSGLEQALRRLEGDR